MCCIQAFHLPEEHTQVGRSGAWFKPHPFPGLNLGELLASSPSISSGVQTTVGGEDSNVKMRQGFKEFRMAPGIVSAH